MNKDAAGNIYMAGIFDVTPVNFGALTLSYTIPGNIGDMFIVKYNASGNAIWAHSAGGYEAEVAESVTTDASGNVYVTGFFSSNSIQFGTTSLTNTSTSTSGDMFLAKYDSLGNVIWAKSSGGAGTDKGISVVADNLGNVYVGGYFNSPSITFGGTTLLNSGSYDAFLTKYDSTGNVVWAKKAGGNDEDLCTSVVLDSFGHLYWVGTFSSGSMAIDTVTLLNSGDYDIFLAKYDTAGNPLWAKRAGGADNDDPFSITLDSAQNIYISGSFFGRSSATFDTITLVNSCYGETFLAKYDPDGNVVWAKAFPGSSSSSCVTADDSGNIYLAGSFIDSITFGPTTFICHDLDVGSTDLFVAKYKTDGSYVWAINAGSPGYDKAKALVFQSPASLYFTGIFYAPEMHFSGIQATSSDTSSAIPTNIFLAKLNTQFNPTLNTPGLKAPVISFMPNPTTGIITIQGTENATMKICNILGQPIKEEHNTTTISIAECPPGMYFISIFNQQGLLLKQDKIIRQ